MRRKPSDIDVGTFSGRVAYCRIQNNLSQEKLAELANLSVQFVSQVEQGRTNVRSEHLLRLADALNVSVDFLLRGEITQVEANALVKSIETLSGEQFLHLKNIVFEYCASHGGQ